MLTDIFAHRYATVKLWDTFGEPERRLVVQSFRILSEQICPYSTNGKETERGESFWGDLQSRVAMELGLTTLSPTHFTYNWGGTPQVRTNNMQKVCENWAFKQFVDGAVSPDTFIKERLSLVELGFRKRSEEIAEAAAKAGGTLADFGSACPEQTSRIRPK